MIIFCLNFIEDHELSNQLQRESRLDDHTDKNGSSIISQRPSTNILLDNLNNSFARSKIGDKEKSYESNKEKNVYGDSNEKPPLAKSSYRSNYK